jgi:hypothetical protein
MTTTNDLPIGPATEAMEGDPLVDASRAWPDDAVYGESYRHRRRETRHEAAPADMGQ